MKSSCLCLVLVTSLLMSCGEDRVITKDAIRTKAIKDLRTIGLENTGGLEIKVDHLMRATMHEDGRVEYEALAHKVFVYRKFGGIRVEGAHIVLSYNLDGSLQKILMQWPSFSVREPLMPKTLDEAEVIEAIVQELKAHDMQDATGIRSRIGFIVDSGELRMVAIVTGEMNGPNKSVFLREIYVKI